MIKMLTNLPPEIKSQLTLEDVEVDQFFITNEGHLCQKVTGTAYTIIAGSDGRPFASWVDEIDGDRPIKKILDKVVKIEFE